MSNDERFLKENTNITYNIHKQALKIRELEITLVERTRELEQLSQKVQTLEDDIENLEKALSSAQTLFKVVSFFLSGVLTFLIGYLLKVL